MSGNSPHQPPVGVQQPSAQHAAKRCPILHDFDLLQHWYGLTATCHAVTMLVRWCQLYSMLMYDSICEVLRPATATNTGAQSSDITTSGICCLIN